jgi:hypothetical protein
MDDWDIRNSVEMATLRADLMACPPSIRGEILADFMQDPVIAVGFRLRARISDVTRGLFIESSMLPRWWREIVENVVPVDGRHPNEHVLRSFLTAAKRAGWSDPRMESAPSPCRM